MRQYKISEFALLIKDILLSNRDALVVFSGFSGEGKSTFSIHLAKEMCKVFNRKFDYEKNMAIHDDDFLHKVLTLPKYSTLIGDEAINIFFRRESLNKDRIKAIKIMDTIRKRNLCLILCIPQFWSLDSHIVQGKVRFWGYIDRRKACHLFKPIRHPFSDDVWSKRINNKMVYNWDDLSYINRIKNYMGTFAFEKLSKDEEEQYYKLYMKKQEAEEKKIFKNINQFRDFIRMTELMGILKLKNAKLLKPGAVNFLAQMEGIGAPSMCNRFDSLQKKLNPYLKKNELIFTKNLKFDVSQ